MILWRESGSMTKTPSGVTENSELVHNGSGNHRKTFRVSGRARCVGRKGCGQRKLRAFGAETRETTIHVLIPLSSVQLEDLRRDRRPQTRPSGQRSPKQDLSKHAPLAASTQQFLILPQQSQAEGVGGNDAVSTW